MLLTPEDRWRFTLDWMRDLVNPQRQPGIVLYAFATATTFLGLIKSAGGAGDVVQNALTDVIDYDNQVRPKLKPKNADRYIAARAIVLKAWENRTKQSLLDFINDTLDLLGNLL